MVGFSRAVRVVPFSAVGGTAPVDAIVRASRFVNPEWLVESEVDAVVSDGVPVSMIGPPRDEAGARS